jgi:hypothetical protein
MGVVIPHADGFPGMKMHYFRAGQWKRGGRKKKSYGRVEHEELTPRKNTWNYCCFFFYLFFLKSKYISRLDDCQIIDQTRKVVVCVWREQLLPSLRLNHISLILYLQTQFARRLVLTRIIKEPASRIAELSDQINKNERREEIFKKKTRPLDMEDSSHLPALLIWQILYEPEIPGHTPK